MAATFRVSVDLSELIAVGPLVRAEVFSHLSGAVTAVAEAGVERWQRAVLKAPLWDGERQAYAASIHYRQLTPFSAEIVSDYKFVEDIESGRPAYDMKRMLDSSMKVRVSKKGKRYLIIPMRHNTPGHSAHAAPMPAAVYAHAKTLTPSSITGHGWRQSGTGTLDIKTRKPFLVRQRKYQWGDRLPAGLAPKLQQHHKSDPYAGMVKFKANSPSGAKSSTYLTFRVMAEGSSGWIIPAKPGLWIARAVADSLQRTADTDFPTAIARDLAA